MNENTSHIYVVVTKTGNEIKFRAGSVNSRSGIIKFELDGKVVGTFIVSEIAGWYVKT